MVLSYPSFILLPPHLRGIPLAPSFILSGKTFYQVLSDKRFIFYPPPLKQSPGSFKCITSIHVGHPCCVWSKLSTPAKLLKFMVQRCGMQAQQCHEPQVGILRFARAEPLEHGFQSSRQVFVTSHALPTGKEKTWNSTGPSPNWGGEMCWQR